MYGQSQCAIQNMVFVWVDTNIDENDSDTQYTLERLRGILNDVILFPESDPCIKFVSESSTDTVTIITSGSLGKDLVPRIHNMVQVEEIYIFCKETSRHKSWTKRWSKIKGVYDLIEPICEALDQSVKQANQNSTPISLVRLGKEELASGLDALNPIFICTKMIKNLVTEVKVNDRSSHELINYARSIYTGNPSESRIIDEFEQAYEQQRAIWWYTRSCFLLRMLNHAIGLLDACMIVDMAFFIQDLHNQIQGLHLEQCPQYNGELFFLYRGQCLSMINFEQMKKTRGGLLTFNSFLLASKDPNAELLVTDVATYQENMVGVLFTITIDPKQLSVPFANVQNEAFGESRVDLFLFSIHTTFRIGEIRSLDKRQAVFEVNLSLATDDDKDLRLLNCRIENELESQDAHGLQLLGELLIKMQQYDSAEEFYLKLLDHTSNDFDEAHRYVILAQIKEKQNAYEEALGYYQQAITIFEKVPNSANRELGNLYFSVGSIYSKLGEYFKASFYHSCSMDIREKPVPRDYTLLMESYKSMALVYDNLGEYARALLYYQKSLDLEKKSLPIDEISLSKTYENIGSIHIKMARYSAALSCFTTALQMLHTLVPNDHPQVITIYNKLGIIHENTGEFTKALSSYNKAIDNRPKTCAINRLHCIVSYNNLAILHLKRGDCQKALQLSTKVLDLSRLVMPQDHPHVAIVYNNIALVYDEMGKYLEALSFYNKAALILENKLSQDHPVLATYYNNIGLLFDKIGDHRKAKASLEKALALRLKTLPADHPDLATSYDSMGVLHTRMGQYSEALRCYDSAFGVRQQILSHDHLDLATSYQHIGFTYESMREYSKSRTYYEKAIEIYRKSLPLNHSRLITCSNNLAGIHLYMKEHRRALSCYNQVLDMKEKTLSENHPSFANTYSNIAAVHYHMGQYSKALSLFQKALNIQEKSDSLNPGGIRDTNRWIEVVKKKL